jgi:hypothetical protein
MKRFGLLVAGCLLLAGVVQAADFDFSGTFSRDNQIDRMFFTVGEDSTITIFSSSWDEGGFDPMLAVWNDAGLLMYQQDDGQNAGSTLSNGVLYDHGVWDSYYSVFLGAGDYSATIAQYNNWAVSSDINDGFIYDGDAHFTRTEGFGPQEYFNGVWSIPNDPRTGDYAFHILNVEEARIVHGVPDAGATVALLGLALAGIGALRRKLA